MPSVVEMLTFKCAGLKVKIKISITSYMYSIVSLFRPQYNKTGSLIILSSLDTSH